MKTIEKSKLQKSIQKIESGSFDENDIDNIIGILYIKDLIIEAYKNGFDKISIKKLLHQAYFIPETKNINELFHELKAKKNHMAVLIDEYGGFSGIITIEDLIEEIMGDIDDEYDEYDPDILKTEENTYLLKGSTPINEINETLKLKIPTDSDTISGFLISLIGYFPEEFEELTPNTDSGSYYSYILKRLLIAFIDPQGKKVLLSISMQKGSSEIGKKSFIVGDDNNWNYVYSNETGTNLSGIGWAEPVIYESFTLNIFTEKAPGASELDNAVFKWIDAGWSGINMVKRSHVQAGIDRYLAGFKEVMARGNVQEISAEKKRLEALTQEQRLQEFFPYARYVQEQSLRGSNPDAYKNIAKDGAYGSTMSPERLTSQMLKNYLRKSMNKVDILELPSPNEKQ